MAVCLKKAVHHFSRYGFFIALACCMGLSAMVRGASVQSTSPAYFISIDALQPVLLKAAADGGVLKGRHGFSWLLAGALVYDRALPLVTLTAASHISTITCTPPSRHGIVANAFLKGGAEHNGFTEPFRQEPLWRSAMRQGKKVLTLGYVGADNTAAERHADFTLSFPDETLLGPEQRLSWQVEQLPAAVDWTLPEEMAAASGLRETTLTIVLNPQSGERRTLPGETGRANVPFCFTKPGSTT